MPIDVALTPQVVVASTAIIGLFSGGVWRLIIQPLKTVSARVNALESRMTSQEKTTENIANALNDLGQQQHELRDDMKKYYDQQVLNNTEMRNHFDRKFENINTALLNAQYITRLMHKKNNNDDDV